MAIPISKYIDITTKVSNDVLGDRDWSGLVFTTTAMKTGASKKTDFETNLKVVSLTADEVAEQFDDSTVKSLCANYFAYNGGTKKPTHINMAFVGEDESALDAYTRITAGTSTVDAFINFGSFMFLGSFTVGSAGDEKLLDVATANENNMYGWVMVVETNSTNQSSDSAALDGMRLVHLTHAAIAAVAWYASVDYSVAGSAGSIDYKQFSGLTATITSASAKDAADALKVNYIGQVQTYGNALSFYQQGMNMDGTDLGVIRDMCWINSEISKAYFNLQNSQQKVPANYVGAAMVQNIIVEVASRSIENGAILLDKPLTSDQVSEINSYAGVDTAADSVSSTGYFVATKIMKVGNRYVCQYTLIYAKGDHIGKVTGLHVLI